MKRQGQTFNRREVAAGRRMARSMGVKPAPLTYYAALARRARALAAQLGDPNTLTTSVIRASAAALAGDPVEADWLCMSQYD